MEALRLYQVAKVYVHYRKKAICYLHVALTR